LRYNVEGVGSRVDRLESYNLGSYLVDISDHCHPAKEDKRAGISVPQTAWGREYRMQMPDSDAAR